ncbi:PQQ-binding-like beta-propeller repeat protein [Haloarchaeobius sp. HRN-SO-5]|uniref:outer membrane protein assembly factor BamB family protein n=1 Tax=Haloarchaeobius sp. HRN-SO-5 TaxID=3446118 RepID=UPI003EB99F7D
MSGISPSRRGLLALAVGAFAGGQAARPAIFRDEFDADDSVSTDEWLLPGRTPARRNHVPTTGGPGLDVAWDVTFDAETGYTLAVAGGRVVVPTWSDGVYAFTVQDGERAWRYLPPSRFEGGVAVAGGRVCCPTMKGFHVLGSDGDPGWHLPDYWQRSVVLPFFIFDTYLPVGTTLFTLGDRGLEARDLSSGLLHWHTERVDGEHVSPNPVAFADGTLYCREGSLHTRLSAFDAGDGSSLWQRSSEEYHHRNVAVVEGTLLSAGGFDSNGRLRAFSTDDGSLRWEQAAGTPLYDVAVADGLAICPGRGGEVHAFDSESGERLWRVDVRDDLGGTVLTDDHLYVHRGRGVEVRDPATGERRATYDLADDGRPHELAYASGHLFALRDRTLYALEVRR